MTRPDEDEDEAEAEDEETFPHFLAGVLLGPSVTPEEDVTTAEGAAHDAFFDDGVPAKTRPPPPDEEAAEDEATLRPVEPKAVARLLTVPLPPLSGAPHVAQNLSENPCFLPHLVQKPIEC
uniref:Uncharacterized protein n=1 Tax=Sexangularia sp. CB-2014 TaxID=1486929 RepID=A0A7S1VB96_9EUKA|mmetsp:Transcript_15479/g.48436  ORF Transcript_15479/g.48436 Transcript_15479/m.48436 type:complete len:121 (+) Transcript_15479:269-631(+)